MKNITLVTIAVIAFLTINMALANAQHMGGGPGMMGGMMERGSMHDDRDREPRYDTPEGRQYQERESQQSRMPMEEKDVRVLLDDYLRSTRNPNPKLGMIEDKGPVFEAEILTKEGSLVDRVAVDKITGGMHSVY